MRDISEILQNLETPEVDLKTHRTLFKAKLLDSFSENQSKSFLGGGEYMAFFKSKIYSEKIAIGAFLSLILLFFAVQFGAFNPQKANAQDIVKKALERVSQLPQAEQARLASEKDKLEKAQKASDLHIVPTANGANPKITVLKFTGENGEEETIEVGDDDSPVVSGVTPGVSPSVSQSLDKESSGDSREGRTGTVAPTATASPVITGIKHSISGSGDDIESSEEKKSENNREFED